MGINQNSRQVQDLSTRVIKYKGTQMFWPQTSIYPNVKLRTANFESLWSVHERLGTMNEWACLSGAHSLGHIHPYGESTLERFGRLILSFKRPEVEKWKKFVEGLVWDFSSIFSVISGSNFHVYELRAQCGLWKSICSFCHLLHHQESPGGKGQAVCECACARMCVMEKISHDFITVIFLEINSSSTKFWLVCSVSLHDRRFIQGVDLLRWWSDCQEQKYFANCVHTIFDKQTILFSTLT